MLPKTLTLDAEGNPIEKTKELEVNYNPDEMTLDELCLFEAGGFSARGFLNFLADHTNWTRQEIGKLTLAELKDVTEQLGAKLQAHSVPLEN